MTPLDQELGMVRGGMEVPRYLEPRQFVLELHRVRRVPPEGPVHDREKLVLLPQQVAVSLSLEYP